MIDTMDDLSFADINECLDAARYSFAMDYNERIEVLNQREDWLKQRLHELNLKKDAIAQVDGTLRPVLSLTILVLFYGTIYSTSE